MAPTKRLAALLVSTLLAASPVAAAPSRPDDRIRVMLNGAFWASKPSFGDTREYPEYAETAKVSSRYRLETAFGPDLALEVSLYRGLGILVGYSGTSRGETGTFDARRPHPLYLGKDRSLSGNLSGYRYQERAVHLDLAFAGASGRLGWAVFAGATQFQVEADLLDVLAYGDTYPYDELTLQSAPAVRRSVSPIGFNAGGTLDYRIAWRLGFGVQLRYSAAGVKLRATPDATEASFNAGGLQAAAGLRVSF